MFDNDWNYSEISKLLGMKTSDFIRWKQSMKPDFIAFVGDEDQPDFTIYTDGDDGLVAFVKDNEMFDSGIKIYLGSGYVDISPSIMSKIMRGLK